MFIEEYVIIERNNEDNNMAWERLDIDDLRLVLSEDEVEKLNERSLSEGKLSVIIQEQLDVVADAFRGAWQSKGYNIDVRDHYVAPEYKQFVLNYARWQIWTRFPMTEDFALSEPRQKQYEEASELLKNPYLGTSEPDYSDDPELSATHTNVKDGAITVPWLKFQPLPFDTGFPQAYWNGGIIK